MSLWGRIFAAGYDRVFARAERAGLRAERAALLAGARGDVLELGAGTGLNLSHYGPDVTRLVLTEPDESMARRLERRLRERHRDGAVVRAPAESLPFAADSFDTVISTLVLCTVADREATLREVARVLRPGGRMLFFEHVRAEEPRLARRQDRIAPAWRLFGRGCRCNSDTVALIERSPLALERVEACRVPKAPAFVRPAVRGAAVAQ